MDQSGNNHQLLRASQSAPPAYNGQHAAADRMRELLDERFDDQYDRVRSVDGKLDAQPAAVEQAVAKAVEAATGDIIARIASLEDTVLTLAEALLRPALRVPQPTHAAHNGHG